MSFLIPLIITLGSLLLYVIVAIHGAKIETILILGGTVIIAITGSWFAWVTYIVVEHADVASIVAGLSS